MEIREVVDKDKKISETRGAPVSKSCDVMVQATGTPGVLRCYGEC